MLNWSQNSLMQSVSVSSYESESINKVNLSIASKLKLSHYTPRRRLGEEEV
jgi:hypothetical protein